MIFLTSCVSAPVQATDMNSHLITPSVTMSPVPTTTTFIAPVLTEKPPLSPTEREATIKELMATNAGCSLPCFWGITSGITDWKTAANFLQSIGATVGDVEVNSGTHYHSVVFKDENLTTGDSFGFSETLNVVDSIFASGNLYGSSTRNVKDFTSLWALYSPKKILNNYGIPSRVLLSSVFAPGLGDGRHGYTLWVFYDHLGFMVRYDGTVPDLPVYHICPQFQEDGDITRIDLALQNPSNSSPLELQDSILGGSAAPRVILSIEDAAGISVPEFQKLFAREESLPCFDTPREIWKIKQ